MFRRAVSAGWIIAGLSCAAATVQLKEGASVSGKILAEKKDAVVVDIGYTVLTIPRTQIEWIVESVASSSVARAMAPSKSAPVEVKAGFFATMNAAAPDRSVRDLVVGLGQCVVQVRTPGGLGSGFFINEDGYLITNFQVIENETLISIEVYHQRNNQLERRSYKQVRIVAMNKFADLTLLKVEDKDAPKFAHVPLGDSEALAVGERVFAVGSPLGLERTVTEGIVSTKTRQIQGELYLQTTTQINPGNSGGPLFNLKGEVVGVTNMKLTFAEGLGFAIPVDQVKFFPNHRDAYACDNDNPSNAYRYLEPPSRTKTAAASKYSETK